MSLDGVVFQIDSNTYRFSISVDLYTTTAIFKTCYVFIDKCYLYLRYADERNIEVVIKRKDSSPFNTNFSGEFLNELINQRLRVDINQESGKIRELLVAKSLFEGGLINESINEIKAQQNKEDEDDYLKDPRNIGDLKGIG